MHTCLISTDGVYILGHNVIPLGLV